MLNYSDLRDIQKREMGSSAIVALPDDFYKVISLLLEKKKDEALSSQSLLSMREYENMKKIIKAVSMKREEKIVLMAVRGDKDTGGLTLEERQMLKELSEIIMKSRETVKSAWSKENFSLDKETPSGQRIRVIKDVAQYRGVDNSVYGPFKEGDEKVLPSEEAKWLFKAGMAELL